MVEGSGTGLVITSPLVTRLLVNASGALHGLGHEVDEAVEDAFVEPDQDSLQKSAKEHTNGTHR